MAIALATKNVENYSSRSAPVIVLRQMRHAGMAVPMRTVHNVIRYTKAETTRKWVPKSSNQRCMAESGLAKLS